MEGNNDVKSGEPKSGFLNHNEVKNTIFQLQEKERKNEEVEMSQVIRRKL